MAPASGLAHSGRVPPGHPTSSPVPSAAPVEEAARFAETLAGSCATALGEAVAGVILHGSLTLDDYVPGRSDVDLLVVVGEPLTDAQVAALTEAVERRWQRAPGRVELRVVTRQVAASPTPAPPMELYIEITPGRAWRWSAGIPGSATWWWSSRCAARTAAACWARRRPS